MEAKTSMCILYDCLSTLSWGVSSLTFTVELMNFARCVNSKIPMIQRHCHCLLRSNIGEIPAMTRSRWEKTRRMGMKMPLMLGRQGEEAVMKGTC